MQLGAHLERRLPCEGSSGLGVGSASNTTSGSKSEKDTAARGLLLAKFSSAIGRACRPFQAAAHPADQGEWQPHNRPPTAKEPHARRNCVRGGQRQRRFIIPLVSPRPARSSRVSPRLIRCPRSPAHRRRRSRPHEPRRLLASSLRFRQSYGWSVQPHHSSGHAARR